MPSQKKIKVRTHRSTGKRNAKLCGGGHGSSRPKSRSSSVSSSSSFEKVPSPEKKSNNSSPVNPAIQKLKDESTEIDARINELSNGNYSIQSAEDELKRVAAYKTQIEGMLKAYNKGEWTPDKETDELNRKYIENTIHQTNDYYLRNKNSLEERITEYRKRIAELKARQDEITKQIQELKRK